LKLDWRQTIPGQLLRHLEGGCPSLLVGHRWHLRLWLRPLSRGLLLCLRRWWPCCVSVVSRSSWHSFRTALSRGQGTLGELNRLLDSPRPIGKTCFHLICDEAAPLSYSTAARWSSTSTGLTSTAPGGALDLRQRPRAQPRSPREVGPRHAAVPSDSGAALSPNRKLCLPTCLLCSCTSHSRAVCAFSDHSPSTPLPAFRPNAKSTPTNAIELHPCKRTLNSRNSGLFKGLIGLRTL